MKRLQSFNFDERPSDSRYDPIVKALVDDGEVAIELRRGEDFPDTTKVGGVQSALRSRIEKRGRRARVRIVNDDVIVVGLWPKGGGPRKPARRRTAVAA